MSHEIRVIISGVIGKDGFSDFVDSKKAVKSRFSLGSHPTKDMTVWYTVFCNESTKDYIVNKCGYGPGDTITIVGNISIAAYKEIDEIGSNGNTYKKTVIDTVINCIDIPTMHKKLSKPSDQANASQYQQPVQQQEQPPAENAQSAQQYEQPATQGTQPPRTNQTYAEAVAAAEQFDDDDLPI